MALVLADRVKETTTTTGQGTITLAGAANGFRSFSTIGNGNTTYYTIAGQGTSEWEVGIGTYTSSGTTLSRDTVLASSAGGTTKTTFSAGTKDVFVTYPAGKSVYLDASQAVSLPGALSVTGAIVGGTGSAAGNYNLSSFVAPGTWDATTKKAAGLKSIKVTVVGAGGTSATIGPTPTVVQSVGGAGSGGTAILYLPAASIPGPVTITAGSGTNSFGPYNPGSPAPTVTVTSTAGAAGTAAGTTAIATGGAGGTASGGTLNINGQGGGYGCLIVQSTSPVSTTSTRFSGAGGNSVLGLGGAGVIDVSVAGNAGTGYGAGGGGALRFAPGPTPYASGSGSPGIIIVEEFY